MLVGRQELRPSQSYVERAEYHKVSLYRIETRAEGDSEAGLNNGFQLECDFKPHTEARG